MDKDFEGEMMLPMTDLINLQGGGTGVDVYEMVGNELATDLIKFISVCFGASPLCERRTPQATYARAVFSYRMRHTGMHLADIGRFIGRDHSTITHYIRMMDDALAYPRQFKEINRLWQKVTQRYPL